MGRAGVIVCVCGSLVSRNLASLDNCRPKKCLAAFAIFEGAYQVSTKPIQMLSVQEQLQTYPFVP